MDSTMQSKPKTSLHDFNETLGWVKITEENKKKKKVSENLGKPHCGLCVLPEIFEFTISHQQWRRKEKIRYKNLLFYNVLTLQHYIAIVQSVSIIFIAQGVRFYNMNSSLNGNLMDTSFVLLMQYIVKYHWLIQEVHLVCPLKPSLKY